MAEFWQAYGNWILYAVFFFLIIGHHLFMGHGGHGAGPQVGHRADAEGQDHVHGSGQRREGADAPAARRGAGGCH